MVIATGTRPVTLTADADPAGAQLSQMTDAPGGIGTHTGVA
jgi:hypothetical protein